MDRGRLHSTGKNIAAKILAKACGRDDISVGKYIRIRSDRLKGSEFASVSPRNRIAPRNDILWALQSSGLYTVRDLTSLGTLHFRKQPLC